MLKTQTQAQSAQRGDLAPQQALAEINDTVDRATLLANQMLALDLSALIVEHQLDFDIETQRAPVQAHEWALRELSLNLIHNAIKHGCEGGWLTIRLVADSPHAALTVFNSGSGIPAEQRSRPFQPFAPAARAAARAWGWRSAKKLS